MRIDNLTQRDNPARQIAVLVPEFVRQTQVADSASQPALLLLVRGNMRIIVLNIPWYR
jgi:hypothetical protein